MKDITQLGRHWIVDAWCSPAELLDDIDHIHETVIQAISDARETLLDICVHRFSPDGVAVNATLSESHIAIHTWPKLGYFALDLFFCGDADPGAAVKTIEDALKPESLRVLQLGRGVPAWNRSSRKPEERAFAVY